MEMDEEYKKLLKKRNEEEQKRQSVCISFSLEEFNGWPLLRFSLSV